MKKLLAVLAALALSASSAFATGYFVDNRETSGDGTIGTPFKWIKQAGQMVAAGDTIYIRGSTSGVTYVDTLSLRRVSGTDGSPIVMRSYPGEVVILRSSSPATILLTRSQWTFKDLIFDHGASGTSLIRAITIDSTHAKPASNITFSGCEIRNGGYDGIYIVDARDIVFDGCFIHDFIYAGNDAHGIKIETVGDSSVTKVRNVMVKNSRFTRCSGDGTQVFGNTGDDISGYATGIDFVNNVFVEGNPGRSENALDFKACDSCLVYGNTMTGYKNLQTMVVQKGCRSVNVLYNVMSGGMSGIDFHIEGGAGFVQRFHRVIGNLIYGTVGDGSHTSVGFGIKCDGLAEAIISNNTFAGLRAPTSTNPSGKGNAIRIESTVGDSGLFDSVVKNNLWYDVASVVGTSAEISGTVAANNGWFASSGGGVLASSSTDQTGSTNPGFVNAPGGDYRPSYSATSKIIDKGSDSLVVWTFSGTKPDLGYSEWTGSIGYYISPSGEDGTNGHTGTSAALAWRTIGYANTTLPAPNTANGHITVSVADGNYGQAPDPTASPLNGKRFVFSGNPGNPAAARISLGSGVAVTISKPYVDVFGFDFAGPLILASTARRDSLVSCRMPSLYNHADYSVVSNCTATTGAISIGRGQGAAPGQTISGVTVSFCATEAAIDTALAIGTYATGLVTERVDSLTLNRNRLRVTASTPHAATVGAWAMTRSTVLENHYEVISSLSVGGNSVDFWATRDSCYANTWRRDTLVSTGAVEVAHWRDDLVASGTRTIDSCYYQASEGVRPRAEMNGDNFKYNVVVAAGAAWRNYAPIKNTNTLDHNTFVGTPGDGTGSKGIVDFQDATWSGSLNGADLAFTNNIVYGNATAGGVSACGGPTPRNAVYWGGSLNSVASAVTTDFNLYAWYGMEESIGDKSIGWGAYACSAPGNSSEWETAIELIYAPAVADSNSVYGSPHFGLGDGDSLYAAGSLATAPYTLGFDSKARAAGSSGSDIGAVAFSSRPKLQIVRADSNLVYELAPGQIGLAQFQFKNLGNDTLKVDTLYLWNSQLEVVPGNGSYTYNGPPEVNILPGELYSFTVTFKRPTTNPVVTDPQPTPPYIGELSFGLVIDTNDLGYTWATDPVGSPDSVIEDALGIGFGWPVGGTNPVIPHSGP